MGCSQSTHVVQVQKRKIQSLALTQSPQTQQLNRSLMISHKKSPILQIPERGQCFLIGSLTPNEQIFANINIQSMTINTMSLPSGGFTCNNFSSILQIQKDQYFITGGINHDLTKISNQSYIYYSDKHKVTKIASMQQSRYTHASIYSQQQNAVYVIGGRYYGDDSQAILSHCQKYFLEKQQWLTLPSMNISRCTAFTFIWNSTIYVLGGYTGPYQRSTKIQYLDQKNNKWNYLDIQLNRGLQGAILLPTNNNQITIFGGLTNSGPTSSVITINLQQKTIRSRKRLCQKRSLYKGFYKNEKAYLLGGDDSFTYEVYDIVEERSLKVKKQFFISLEHFDSLGFSTSSAVVPYQQEQKKNFSHQIKKQNKQSQQILYILGTTQQPFLCQLNISQPTAQFKSIPLTLRLYAHQGGCFLSQKQLILFGGIQDDSLSVITPDTYLFNISNNTAKKLSPMNQNRYLFTYQLTIDQLKQPQYIYCFGGATSNTNGQLVFLNTCQRFSISQNKWQLIRPLPEKLISPMSLIFNNKIFVFGGTNDKNQKVKNIYMYEQKVDQWLQLQNKLMFGIEAGSVTRVTQNQFFVFGGLVENGQTDGIWSLYFSQKGQNKKKEKEITCTFHQKGQMNQKKSHHKIYQPKNQDFYVVFGGQKDPLTFYRKNLQQQTSDLLLNVKQMFMKVLQQLNHKDLKGYLMLGYDGNNRQ